MSKTRVALAVLGLAAIGGAGAALAAVTSVTLTSAGPRPQAVTINWSDSVVFSNGDGQQQRVNIPRLTVTSPPIPPGGTWTQVFSDRGGNYPFHQVADRSFPGTVFVKVEGEVTLAAKPQSLLYGNSVALRGKSPYPGLDVTIEQRPTGASVWAEATRTPAAEDGAFSTSLAPTIGTRYRATAAAGQLRSGPLSIDVRPRLALRATPRRAATGRRVVLRARVNPAAAARLLDLERYDVRRRRWIREATRGVPASGIVLFRRAIPSGSTRFRVSLRRADLRPGYDQNVSAAVVVRGT